MKIRPASRIFYFMDYQLLTLNYFELEGKSAYPL